MPLPPSQRNGFPNGFALTPQELALVPWAAHVRPGVWHTPGRRHKCDLCGTCYWNRVCDGGLACPRYYGVRRHEVLWLATNGMWLPKRDVEAALMSRGQMLSLQPAGIGSAGTGESLFSAKAEAPAPPPPVVASLQPAGAIAVCQSLMRPPAKPAPPVLQNYKAPPAGFAAHTANWAWAAAMPPPAKAQPVRQAQPDDLPALEQQPEHFFRPDLDFEAEVLEWQCTERPEGLQRSFFHSLD